MEHLIIPHPGAHRSAGNENDRFTVALIFKEEARIIMGFKVWLIEYLPILFGIVVLLKGMKWLRSASFHGRSQS